MLDQNQINKIKEAVQEFFRKMTISVSDMDVSTSLAEMDTDIVKDLAVEQKDVVNLSLKMEEPQILIGQGGQTLFEIQRLLRTVLNKKSAYCPI